MITQGSIKNVIFNVSIAFCIINFVMALMPIFDMSEFYTKGIAMFAFLGWFLSSVAWGAAAFVTNKFFKVEENK